MLVIAAVEGDLVEVDTLAIGFVGLLLVVEDAEGLMFSFEAAGEAGAATAGDSSLGTITGGIGTTLGMGAQVRGTVAGLGSGVPAVTEAVVAGVAGVVVFATVAGRLLG